MEWLIRNLPLVTAGLILLIALLAMRRTVRWCLRLAARTGAGLAVLYLFLMGCVSLFSVMANVLFFKVIAPEYLSRMASIFNAFACLGTPLASLLGGTLSGLLPLFVVFLVCGALCCVQTLIFARMRSLGNLEESLLATSNAS